MQLKASQVQGLEAPNFSPLQAFQPRYPASMQRPAGKQTQLWELRDLGTWLWVQLSKPLWTFSLCKWTQLYYSINVLVKIWLFGGAESASTADKFPKEPFKGSLSTPCLILPYFQRASNNFWYQASSPKDESQECRNRGKLNNFKILNKCYSTVTYKVFIE